MTLLYIRIRSAVTIVTYLRLRFLTGLSMRPLYICCYLYAFVFKCHAIKYKKYIIRKQKLLKLKECTNKIITVETMVQFNIIVTRLNCTRTRVLTATEIFLQQRRSYLLRKIKCFLKMLVKARVFQKVSRFSKEETKSGT